ncbi:MAG: hypothetical protein ACRD8U_02440, partial [Pyrinomonadaceae bacterium]
MSSFDNRSKATSQPVPRRSLRLGVLLSLAALLMLGLGISIYFTSARNKKLQQEVASLDQQVKEVAAKAESARLRATEAEQSARQSATARDQAEGA